MVADRSGKLYRLSECLLSFVKCVCVCNTLVLVFKAVKS
jgi:hypothetical protein